MNLQGVVLHTLRVVFSKLQSVRQQNIYSEGCAMSPDHTRHYAGRAIIAQIDVAANMGIRGKSKEEVFKQITFDRMKFYYLALLPAKDKEFPYSIHGLWPQEGVHKWRACPKGGHKFDIERLRGLLPELHADWHSSRGTDEHFWKHEWEKHGSCTGLTEVEYFQKTLIIL